MDEQDKKALDRCYTKIISDVDPTIVFTQSLHSKGALTAEQRDEIDRNASQQVRAALLMKHIRSRGPRAYSILVRELGKAYPWLAEAITEERSKPTSSEEDFASKLAKVIRNKLLPILYHSGQYPNHFRSMTNNTHAILKQLSDSLSLLNYQCHQALTADMSSAKDENTRGTPLHTQISHRLKQVREAAHEDASAQKIHEDIKELKKEIKKLKKDLKESDHKQQTQANNLKDYDRVKKGRKELRLKVKQQKEEIKELTTKTKNLQNELTAAMLQTTCSTAS